jgi:hypothetical protein
MRLGTDSPSCRRITDKYCFESPRVQASAAATIAASPTRSRSHAGTWWSRSFCTRIPRFHGLPRKLYVYTVFECRVSDEKYWAFAAIEIYRVLRRSLWRETVSCILDRSVLRRWTSNASFSIDRSAYPFL